MPEKMANPPKETRWQTSSSEESLKSSFLHESVMSSFMHRTDCCGISEDQGTSSAPPGSLSPMSPMSPLSPMSPCESNGCLLTPSNIHINHLFVYNFQPEIGRESSPFETTTKLPAKIQSPAASSGPICRICHEGDHKEDLVSPCRCTGTVGLVHKKCMERWLSSRCNVPVDKCEICNYPFATIRKPKSFYEFVQTEGHSSSDRRSFMGDVSCFFLLTPLAIVSGFLTVEGALRQVKIGNSLTAGCLMGLSTFLITAYILWIVLTVRYHIICYLFWRKKHVNVKLMKIKRISTASDGPNQTCIQVVAEEPDDSDPNAVYLFSETQVEV